MADYLELSQALDLPEHKRFEYLAAHQLGMRMWSDIKDEFCQKFNIPQTKDYGIDLVSPDFTKVAQVKCYGIQKSVDWKNAATFIAYSSLIKATPVLVTTPDTKISKMVLRFISDVVFIDNTGIIKTKDDYVDEIVKIIKSKNMSELPYLLRSLNGDKLNKASESNMKLERTKEIEVWIRSNPPCGMTKDAYYEMFKIKVSNPVSKNKLSVIVMGLGYVTDNGPRPRLWKLG